MCRHRFVIVVLAALVGSAHAQITYYVDAGCGDDAWSGTDPGCVAPDGPKATIQAAINAALAGDLIEVGAGTYVEYIDLRGKAITLRAVDGPDVTVIQCNYGGRGITCDEGEGPDTVIEGFTVTLGDAARGGGMYNANSSSPTVIDCTFADNNALTGGGMYNDASSSPTLRNCVFRGNEAMEGGGMFNRGGATTLVDCTFSGNVSYDGGGGMRNLGCSPTLTNCVFKENRAGDLFGGGGMRNDDSSPTLMNCVFSGNEADSYGGGIYNYVSSSPTLTNCTITENSAGRRGGGVYNDGSSNPTLTNCIVWLNSSHLGEPQICDDGDYTTTATYSCIQGDTVWPGTGNVNKNPYLDGAYRPGFGSSCIDAGNNAAVPPDTLDLDGDGDTAEPCPVDLYGPTRFYDDPGTADTGVGEAPIVDMGACEYQPAAAGSADLDGDGDVDLDDFNLFQQQFTGPQP